MQLSALDMFTIGVGPSSSHTVGPMRAACAFVKRLQDKKILESVLQIQVTLYGSLALTGRGHATDRAILLGLMGDLPETVDPETMPQRVQAVRQNKRLTILGVQTIDFYEPTDLLFEGSRRLPLHSNGMEIVVMDRFGRVVDHEVYYSIGGGFIMTQSQLEASQHTSPEVKLQESVAATIAYPFSNMKELKEHCVNHDLTLLDLILANETYWRTSDQMELCALKIWQAMRSCVARGVQTEGTLPGGLEVKRRAAALWKTLQREREELGSTEAMEWLSVYALAVNEENAAGSRVVTAPTNGAAGVIPAVMHFLIDHELPLHGKVDEFRVAREFLLIAGTIGVLYKMGASISAAEMGCQGEIGVASSMAAGAYCFILGGSLAQVEAAAEIAMEHHLGLTCDPIAGLVQIPCIERNTMGAVKAVTAAKLALRGNGEQKVSLDQVIRTMLHTGRDMSSVYKETSLGGLAVNVVEC